MSDVELHRGVMRPIFDAQRSSMTMEEKIQDLTNGEEKPDYLTWEGFLDEWAYGNDAMFLIDGDKIYELDNEELDPYDAYAHIRRMPDGTIEYTASFYNGGTSLNEMLSTALNEDRKKDSHE